MSVVGRDIKQTYLHSQLGQLAWCFLQGCLLHMPAWRDLVKGPLGTLAWVQVLLHNQPWVGWVTVHGGNQALAGQADRGTPSLGLGVGAWALLAVGTGHMTVG